MTVHKKIKGIDILTDKIAKLAVQEAISLSDKLLKFAAHRITSVNSEVENGGKGTPRCSCTIQKCVH